MAIVSDFLNTYSFLFFYIAFSKEIQKWWYLYCVCDSKENMDGQMQKINVSVRAFWIGIELAFFQEICIEDSVTDAIRFVQG